MFLLFPILLFATVISKIQTEECACCELDTPDGKIDFSVLSHGYYIVDPFVPIGHTLTFRIGQNLDTSHRCTISTSTIGPTNVKDEYGSAGCWYAGGIEKCLVGGYDPQERTFQVEYRGFESHELPPITRNMKLLMKCDENMPQKGLLTNCSNDKLEEELFEYNCHLSTPWACPNFNPFDPGPSPISTVVIIVGVLIAMCCGCACGFGAFFGLLYTFQKHEFWSYIVDLGGVSKKVASAVPGGEGVMDNLLQAMGKEDEDEIVDDGDIYENYEMNDQKNRKIETVNLADDGGPGGGKKEGSRKEEKKPLIWE